MKSKITFCTLIGLLLACFQAHAQWTQVGYMVTDGIDTAGLDHGFDAYGNDVYCSTIDGLFRSGDNGDSWQNITDGKANVDGEEFYNVFRAANNDLYAGTSRRLFKSTDNGGNWTWLSTLPDSATWFDATEIGGNILASFSKGSNAGVYYSANGGTSWTLATGITSVPRFFLVDGTTVYLGGGANGVYKSVDNGQSWAIAGTGFPALAGIWGVIKSGGAFFANSVSGKGLFVSRDDCATWANTDTTVFHDFCQVFAITESSGRILASMDGACNAGASIKSSTDIGVSWAAFMDSLPQAYYPNVGRNAAGTSFFAKRGGPAGQKIYRYGLGATAVSDAVTMVAHQAFPNPATDGFTIKISSPNLRGATLVVHDMMGKEVHRQAINGDNMYVPTLDWPRGLYVYAVEGVANLSVKGKVMLR